MSKSTSARTSRPSPTRQTARETRESSWNVELILKSLHQTGFNKKKTAEMLSMSRATLYHKMDEYVISAEPD